MNCLTKLTYIKNYEGTAKKWYGGLLHEYHIAYIHHTALTKVRANQNEYTAVELEFINLQPFQERILLDLSFLFLTVTDGIDPDQINWNAEILIVKIKIFHNKLRRQEEEKEEIKKAELGK